MRIFLFCVLVFSSHSCESADPVDYVKFTKVICSASGNTCTKASCNVKAINRYQSNMNVECVQLKRPLNSFKFAVKVFKINLAGNLRQIMDLHDLPACAIVDNIGLFPMFLGYYDWAEETFPGFIHKCPYEELKCVNASLKLKSSSNVEWPVLPSGKYKLVMKLSDDEDDNIMTLTFWEDIVYRMRDIEF